MPKLIAVIGFLVMSAGLDLLWQSRWDIRYWLEALAKVFRAMLEREKPPQIFPPKEASAKRRRAVQVLLGMGFAFVLGPILLAVSLTLMLYSNS
jgi:hypothetical protein